MEVIAPSQAPSPGPNGVTSPPFAAIDAEVVYDYIRQQLQVTLGATSSELESIGSLFHPSSYDEVIQRIGRFAAESQSALYIQKESVTEGELGDATQESGEISLL
jgi:dynein heavy chain 1